MRDLEQALESATSLAAQGVGRRSRTCRMAGGSTSASGSPRASTPRSFWRRPPKAGVKAFESDDRILCYPVIVQVSASDATIVVDKKKDRRVRPSVVVRHLDALQQRPPKFKPEAFIESLAAAYDYVVGAKGLRPGVARQAGRRAPGADTAAGRRSRLHPPGVRPRPVPARPERRRGTARTAGA